MPDHNSLQLTTDSAELDKISTYTYETILTIQQQHPEWLKEKYRNTAWKNARNQSIFLDRLKQELGNAPDQKAKILKLRKFLQNILESSFFELAFKQLIANVRQMSKPEIPSNGSLDGTTETGKAAGVAILLLDAENLHLDLETEKFLDNICTHPIQIKIAFANWRSMGKKDAELHERHYELIHVPPGKDSADLKMATVGSSIFVHYPTAKEVLVCSSDNAIIHLCTTLQTHGLTVYRVRKQGDAIAVFNTKTGINQTHSRKPVPEIPSIEQFIVQLKQLIKVEQLRTSNQWIKLERISNIFKTKYQFTISQVVATHFPGKRSRDIFFDYPSEFVVHQVAEQSELFITLFKMPEPKTSNGNGLVAASNEQSEIIPGASIGTQAEFEQALVNILLTLTVKSPGSAVSISSLGSEFHKKSGQTISKTLDQLQLNGNFPKFIKSCSSFKLEQTKKGWQVAIAQP